MSDLSSTVFVPMTVGGHLLCSSRFRVTCEKCDHERTLDLASLKRRFGPRTLMADILERLVCEECRARNYSVSANDFEPKTYTAADYRAATRGH